MKDEERNAWHVVEGPLLSVSEYLARWRALPPLVRASAATQWAMRVAYAAKETRGVADDEESVGLTRRPRVTRAFADAHVVLADLLAVLANEADAEAVKAGIDADTKREEAP